MKITGQHRITHTYKVLTVPSYFNSYFHTLNCWEHKLARGFPSTPGARLSSPHFKDLDRHRCEPSLQQARPVEARGRAVAIGNCDMKSASGTCRPPSSPMTPSSRTRGCSGFISLFLLLLLNQISSWLAHMLKRNSSIHIGMHVTNDNLINSVS